MGAIRLPPTNAFVVLAPDLLTVACERIKQAFLREIQLPDRWRGSVNVVIIPVTNIGRQVAITSTRFPNGWKYRAELPEMIEPHQLVAGILQVLLLEFANREAASHSAEIPLWLTEGLTRQLLAAGAADFLPQSQAPVHVAGSVWMVGVNVRSWVRPDPLRQVRERLGTRAPLTFTELSLPTPAQLSGERWETYQDCAQLFLSSLMSLKDGHEDLTQMLKLLPQCLNWQTAFLRAFGGRFQRLLDVEKWWAVDLANFTGRQDAQSLSKAVFLTDLAAILTSSTEVRVASNALPIRSEITLQQVIESWDYSRQRTLLGGKLNELLLLRWNSPRELAGLVEAYRKALESYVRQNEDARSTRASSDRRVFSPRWLAKETVQRLNQLDRERLSLTQTNLARIQNKS